MIDFEYLINKEAKSYELACRCARTNNIYGASVLEAMRYNFNFILHLRSLELDACKQLVLNSIVRAGDIGACRINIVNTNKDDVLKIIANAELDSGLELLECSYYNKRAFKLKDGSYKYIYEVKFDLTL